MNLLFEIELHLALYPLIPQIKTKFKLKSRNVQYNNKRRIFLDSVFINIHNGNITKRCGDADFCENGSNMPLE